VSLVFVTISVLGKALPSNTSNWGRKRWYLRRWAVLGPRKQFAENMEELLLEGSSACYGKVARGAQTLRLGQTLAGEYPAWPLGSPAPLVSRVDKFLPLQGH
jgi:hypothetical protein